MRVKVGGEVEGEGEVYAWYMVHGTWYMVHGTWYMHMHMHMHGMHGTRMVKGMPARRRR